MKQYCRCTRCLYTGTHACIHTTIAIFVETKSDIAMTFYHDNAQLAFDKINIIIVVSISACIDTNGADCTALYTTVTLQ